MDNKQLIITLTDKLLELIKNKTTSSTNEVLSQKANIYTEQTIFEKEKSGWMSQPQLLCFTQDIPEPGNFKVFEHWPLPILVVRDKNGKANAFINACPHRNGKLKTGEGKCHLISCPYHAWSFDLNGDLIKVFEEHTFGDIEKDKFGLTPLLCQEINGMVFVIIDSSIDTFNFDDYLGSMQQELARWELDKLVRIDSKVMNVNCNWKLALETFSEGYHFEPLHKDTVGDYAIGNCSFYETFGINNEHHRIAFPNKTIKELSNVSKSDWPDEKALFSNFQLVHFIFPNNILLVSPTEVEFFQIVLGNDPTKHTTIYNSYVRNSDKLKTKEQQVAAKEHFDFIAKVVIEEDYAMVETIQNTLNSTGNYRLTNYGKNEPALHNLSRCFKQLF